jgi:dihydroflavonol-4-reductase
VRNLEEGAAIYDWLAPHTEKLANLSLVETELLSDQGWDEAMSGCRFVLHLASPFPLLPPAHEDILIRPAVEGTRRVLGAAIRSGVQRVVLTSSVAAVSHGHTSNHRPFTHEDWSTLNGDIGPYQKSKTLAEKTAWDFVANLSEGQHLELVSVNPSFVIGPVLNRQTPTSVSLHQMLMGAAVPGVARIKFDLVDVRDVSKAHLAAMVCDQAAGKRFLCVGGTMWLTEIARILSDRFRPHGYRIPLFQFPDWFVRLYAKFDQRVSLVAKDLGKELAFDISQTQDILNWSPLPLEQSIIEMGESLIEFGVVSNFDEGR